MKYNIWKDLTTLDHFNDNTRLCSDSKHKLYIVKEIPPELVKYYELLSSIDHPNIARIASVRRRDFFSEVARDYISGDCLADLLEEGKLFNEADAARIGCDIARGLSELHSLSLVHRDINPNNIIIADSGVAKIIDFGIIRSFADEQSSDTHIMGTNNYAAPEQFGFEQSDGRTDMYGLGVMLNVMVTGQLPKDKLAPGTLGSIIKRCTMIDRSKRYRDMNELIRALIPLCNEKPNHGEKLLVWRIIDHIPGLRSKNLFFVILGLIGYPLLIAISVYFAVHDFRNPKLSIPIFVIPAQFFIIYVPLIFLANIGDIRENLPGLRDLPKWLRILGALLLSAISFLLGLYLSFLSTR